MVSGMAKSWQVISGDATRMSAGDLRRGAAWPMEADTTSRVFAPGVESYAIDVEFRANSHGELVPIGVAIRVAQPTEPQTGAGALDPTSVRRPEGTEPRPVSARDV